jgi:hypothetical protein
MRSTFATVAFALSHQCCVLSQPPASMGVPIDLVRKHATTGAHGT